jgi:flagellar biosynthesis protein FliR
VNGVLGAMNPVTPSMEVSSAAVPRQVTTGFAQLMA